jgi:hypothetical protein
LLEVDLEEGTVEAVVELVDLQYFSNFSPTLGINTSYYSSGRVRR